MPTKQVAALEQPPAAAPKFKLPKSLAATADRYYQLREQRYAADKVAAGLKEEETFLREHLIQNIAKSDARGVIGQVCRVTIKMKKRYEVTDWDKVWDYVFRNRSKGGTALLQRRLSDTAVAEIFEKGKKLEGVTPVDYPDISVNKV